MAERQVDGGAECAELYAGPDHGRAVEQACGDTWRNIRDDLKQIKLAQLSSANGIVWQVTEPSPNASKRLKELRIPKPPPILDLT